MGIHQAVEGSHWPMPDRLKGACSREDRADHCGRSACAVPWVLLV